MGLSTPRFILPLPARRCRTLSDCWTVEQLWQSTITCVHFSATSGATIFAIPLFTILPSFLLSRYHKVWVYQPLGLSSPSLPDARPYPLPPYPPPVKRKILAPYPPTSLLPRARCETLHCLACPNPVLEVTFQLTQMGRGEDLSSVLH